MVCCCLICGAGSGVIACIFSLIFSIVSTSHLIGFVSPKWFKDYEDNTLKGLYTQCDDYFDCDRRVSNDTLMVLAVIVLLSSIALLLVFLIITCCTPYRYLSLGTIMTMLFGGWFILQEILTVVIMSIVATEYNEIGWSTYFFCLPGIAALPIIFLILLYKKCCSSPIGIV